MRVLHVIGAMDRGGAETMIMNLYRAIDREKVQFDFLVHEQRECDYDAEILSLGGRIFRLPRFTGMNYFTYRKLCREFFAAHDEHRVVHGHIGSCAAIYLDEARKAGRYAIAHSHAQNYEKGLGGVAFRALSRPVRKKADWFFACSREAGVDRFGEAVVEGDSFTVLNNGINVGAYACDEAAHEEAKRAFGLQGRFVVGHVGRFVEVKNHRFLLEVFAQVAKERPDAVLLLLGRGPLEQDVKEQVASLSLDDKVRFMGVRDDVPFVAKAFDAFVFPSESEGLAMAAVEAQAAGARCVISSGVPERALVSPYACRLELACGVKAWADEVLGSASVAHERMAGAEGARAHGFDIQDTARWLLGFYLEKG